MSFFIPAEVVGGISWATKTTNYTAANGNYLLCNTSAGAFTVTLPTSPATNNTIYIQDASGSFNINPLTVDPGAKTIMGMSGTLVSTQLNAGFGLIYNGTEWRIF